MAETKRRYWSPLPTATQLRLLRLVLAPALDEAALDAWTRSVVLEDLDEGSVRLLPALYLRLKAAGINHPWLAIMRGWYRRAFYRNRLIIHRGLDLVGALENHGAACLLLKGCPLTALYYGDAGARPMGDFDILIAESLSRRRVEEIMAETGRATLKNRSLHADTYLDRDGFEYDLHWYLVPELAVLGWSRGLWDRAQSVTVEARRFRTLSSEDHLFHALIHGMRVSDVPPLRWIVDVATIAGKAAPVDWLRVAENAEQRAITAPVARGLGFLLDSGILGEEARAAGAALSAAASPDRLLFAGLMRPPSLAFRLLRPWLLYRRLVRLAEGAGRPMERTGFPRFLVELWNLDSRRQIPAALWRKILARLRGISADA
jgi:hypothetical protein